MNKKISALFCIILVLFSGTSNLFAAAPHQCEVDMQENDNHCPITMEKMDCCPVEQQDNSCKCPEMSSNNDLPGETSPVVFFDSVNSSFGKFISIQYDIVNLESETQKKFPSFEIAFSALNNNKIYKTIHSFLI